MRDHTTTAIAIVAGKELPLWQVVYEGPDKDDPDAQPWFTLVFDDAPSPDELSESQPECMDCVIRDYGQPVAFPVGLALKNGCSMVRNPDTDQWEAVPDYFNEEALEP